MSKQNMENSETSITKTKKDVIEKNKKITEAYRKVLATQEGKDVFFDLLAFCGIYNEHFTGNSETFRNLGRHSVGLKIINEIGKTAPKAYAKLLLEYDCDSK